MNKTLGPTLGVFNVDEIIDRRHTAQCGIGIMHDKLKYYKRL